MHSSLPTLLPLRPRICWYSLPATSLAASETLSPSPDLGAAGVQHLTFSLTHHHSFYCPEPQGLNSSALISQLRLNAEENEASSGREVLCDPSGRRWVPNKQGQPYYRVCIYLHEDELLSSSSRTIGS